MKNLIPTLMTYLKEKGYPQSSFNLNHEIIDKENKRHKIDLAVIDIETTEPVMLFQLRENPIILETAGFYGRTMFIQRLFGNKQVPLYYVFPGSNGNGISIYQFAKISGKVESIPIDIDANINVPLIEKPSQSVGDGVGSKFSTSKNDTETMLPQYKELLSSSRYEDLNNIQSYQKRLTNAYTILGYVLAGLFFTFWLVTKIDDILVFKDFLDKKEYIKTVFKLDLIDLGLFSLITLLILLPHIEKISFGNVSLKLKNEQIKE